MSIRGRCWLSLFAAVVCRWLRFLLLAVRVVLVCGCSGLFSSSVLLAVVVVVVVLTCACFGVVRCLLLLLCVGIFVASLGVVAARSYSCLLFVTVRCRCWLMC